MFLARLLDPYVGNLADPWDAVHLVSWIGFVGGLILAFGLVILIRCIDHEGLIVKIASCFGVIMCLGGLFVVMEVVSILEDVQMPGPLYALPAFAPFLLIVVYFVLDLINRSVARA